MAIGEFSGYLSGAFPSQINFDVTQFCNLACIHCPYEEMTKTKGASRKNLRIDWHAKVIDEIASVGRDICRYIRYTGDGEPLLHPELAKMIAYAKAHTDAPIALTTNGMLLTEKRAIALLEAGVDVFDVSIDAHTQDVYAKVRVNGDLDVTRACTLRLIELSALMGRRAKVIVSFVRQPLNEHEALSFEAEWKAAGADYVVLRNRHSCAGNVADMAKLLWEQAPAIRKPCLYPWERLTVKADGEVSYCPTDWGHEANIGNIDTQSVQEIWKGSKMNALREAHTTGNFGKHAFCGACPDWSVIKWPSEGRSYASMMHEFTPQKPAA